MTPEQEQSLFTSLGRIEQKLDNCVETLTLHTAQDGENFRRLEAGQDDIRDRQIREVEGKIEALKLIAAEKKGADDAAARMASKTGGTWGAVLGSLVSIIIAAIAAYFGK